MFVDFSQESFREFITFFLKFNRVTHSSRSDSDELEAPFSSERALCITLRFLKTQFYRKFVTLPWQCRIRVVQFYKMFKLFYRCKVPHLAGRINQTPIRFFNIALLKHSKTSFIIGCNDIICKKSPLLILFRQRWIFLWLTRQNDHLHGGLGELFSGESAFILLYL